jgi:hypothetical protein
MIFNVIGTPNQKEVDKLEKEDTKKYVSCFKKRSPVPLNTIDRFKVRLLSSSTIAGAPEYD